MRQESKPFALVHRHDRCSLFLTAQSYSGAAIRRSETYVAVRCGYCGHSCRRRGGPEKIWIVGLDDCDDMSYTSRNILS